MELLRKHLHLLGAISLTLAGPSAFAASFYWDTDSDIAGSGGAAPSGSWATGGTTWSTDSTGATVTSALTTAGIDDLFFSAATDATGSYTVTLGADQSAKSLTFEEGAATLTANTLTLAGGGITVLAGAGDPIISSNLTINGNSNFNVGAGRTLTLNTGTFTRGTRATVNIQGGGTGSSTMTGLSANDATGIIGPWASSGSGTGTTYAKFSGSNLSGLGYTEGPDGSAVATSNLVVTGAGNLNYSLAAFGTLGASASVNTLRYTGATGTLVASTSFTTKGLMNVSGVRLDLNGTWTAGNSATEMVINAANGEIRLVGTDSSLTGTITKTGSGTFTLGTGTGTNYSGIGGITVNQGIFSTSAPNSNTIVGATINSGGTLQWRGSNKHKDDAVFTVNAGGTLDIGAQNDTIGGLSGSGTVTGTSGYIQLSNGNTFSGNITGAIGIRTSATTSDQILSGASDYSGGTQINAGFLQLGNSTAAGSGTIQLGATSGSDTAELRLAGSGTTVTNALTVNTGSSGTKTFANRSTNTIIYSGSITANDNLFIVGNMNGTSNSFAISGSTNSIAVGKTVGLSSTGTSTGSVIDNAVWSGDGSITYTSNNNGGFVISGPKTYTGGATLGAMTGAGVVTVTSSTTGPANAPTSGLFGMGTLSIGATKMRGSTTTNITIGNAISFTDNPTFTTRVDEKSLIFSGNATLGATRTLTVETGSTVATEAVIFSGQISGSGFGIIKAGAGTLRLSGTNSYTGDTTVNAGVLAVSGTSIANTGTLVIDGSGKVDLTNTESVNKLFFGAVEQPLGDYSATSVPPGATITTASFSGTGTLTVVAAPTNTFANWISNPTFGLAVADQDLGDDPDGDGRDNGVENFFGTNPGTFTQGLLVGVKSGNTFTFTHPQNATPASDLTASYRWSKDLATFLAGGATDGEGTTVTFSTQADIPSPGITTVTATVTGTAADKLFVRVNVTQP